LHWSSAWFPEDQCKMHIVVWGITPAHHAALQSISRDIYHVAEYLADHDIAHAVAHPIYRQNEKLERWHLERLILLFKGFECLNGAHSPLHREAFEPLLDKLDETELKRLSDRHGLRPLWPDPHVKSRTAGSDDHGLLNIGRTWTEFPESTRTPADVLNHLRTGNCRPGGESGSSVKLAHTFYSVAIRYYSRQVMRPGHSANLATMLLQTMVGERPVPTKSELARLTLKSKAKRFLKSLVPPVFLPKPKEIPTLREMFLDAVKEHLPRHSNLLDPQHIQLPPLGEHDDVFRFISDLNRDISARLAHAVGASIDAASFTGLFNTISSILGQQFVLLPYYFALFHQNKERRLLRSLTGQIPVPTARTLRVGWFTDTLDDVNGVSRFIRDLASLAHARGLPLIVHTSTNTPTVDLPNRKNFPPLYSHELPGYPDLLLNLPPLLDVLEFAERQQYDVIHVSTPGPMGLVGLLVAAMLRVPCLGTYHTDFPAYAQDLTGDHRVVRGATQYMQWFFRRLTRVFARSREYMASLQGLLIPSNRIALIHPAVDRDKFNPARRDEAIWQRLNIPQQHRLLYAGRVSLEKNMPLLAESFRRLCQRRTDVALVIAGDGPFRKQLQSQLAGLPAHFLGFQDDAALATLYASSDLFLFPSRTDTLGQVVLEAQSSGLPPLVTEEGGPKETIVDNVTGLVLPPTDAAAWADAIDELLNDPARRATMSRIAAEHAARFSLDRAFDAFWNEHLSAIEEAPDLHPGLRQTSDEGVLNT
jgi:glycosyltransferase involved in cell wall biosynthesis